MQKTHKVMQDDLPVKAVPSSRQQRGLLVSFLQCHFCIGYLRAPKCFKSYEERATQSEQ